MMKDIVTCKAYITLNAKNKNKNKNKIVQQKLYHVNYSHLQLSPSKSTRNLKWLHLAQKIYRSKPKKIKLKIRLPGLKHRKR